MAQVALAAGAGGGRHEALSGVVHPEGIRSSWPGVTKLGLAMLLKLAMSQMPEL